MQKDLPLVALYGELVAPEKFLVLLLFDLGHDGLRFLQKGVNNAKQSFLPVRVMSAAAEFNRLQGRRWKRARLVLCAS